MPKLWMSGVGTLCAIAHYRVALYVNNLYDFKVQIKIRSLKIDYHVNEKNNMYCADNILTFGVYSSLFAPNKHLIRLSLVLQILETNLASVCCSRIYLIKIKCPFEIIIHY